MAAEIQIKELNNLGDKRGSSFTTPAEALSFVGRMADLHLASIKPGAVRGNHYHLRRLALITVLPGVKWSLHWDEGASSATQHREFDGGCPVLLLIPPLASHALRNDGTDDLWWLSISSEPYDPAESMARKVI